MATNAATSVGAAVAAAAAAATTGTSCTSATSSNSNQMNDDDNSTLVYCQLQIEHCNRDIFSVNVRGDPSIHQIKEAIRSKISFLETMKLYGEKENELNDNIKWSNDVSWGKSDTPLIVKIDAVSSTINENEDKNVKDDAVGFIVADESAASLPIRVDIHNMQVFYLNKKNEFDGKEIKRTDKIKRTDEENVYLKDLQTEAKKLLKDIKLAAPQVQDGGDHTMTDGTEKGTDGLVTSQQGQDGGDELTTDGTGKETTYIIDEEKLKTLVKKATELSNPKPPLHHAARAALFANAEAPELDVYGDLGEMYMQQSLYSPIAEMFLAFSTRYRADQQVKCAHAIKSYKEKGPNQNGPVEVCNYYASCLPDAALRLGKAAYLIAMMELKVKNTGKEYKNDFYRCNLMTTMSVLAVASCLKTKDRTSNNGIDIAIPFIQGNLENADLYVTRLSTNNSHPQIHLVARASFSNQNNQNKIVFLARLAVLLSRIVQLNNENKELMDSYLDDVKLRNMDLKLNNAIQSSASKRPSESDQSGSTAKSSQTNKTNTTGNTSTSANETAAQLAASQCGLVKDLAHPFLRIRSLNLDLFDDKNATYEEDLKYFQQESPFFFKGVTNQDGTVFCKVWREGDRHTSRKDIEEEIHLYKLANTNGIPSPKVVDRLTVLDMDCMTPLDLEDFKPSTYHMLVTQYHRNDKVAECDIGVFAISLVNAVQKLHSIGILHCDIKPNNILWDATQKKLLLIDFGHAQEELNARWYTSTRMFEAPEISQKEPHSTKSDAFSVGKTLEYVIAKFLNKVDPGIAGVVQSLINELESKRLLLADAETQLKQYNNVNVDPTTTTTATATKKRSIGDIDTDTAMDGSPTSIIHI